MKRIPAMLLVVCILLSSAVCASDAWTLEGTVLRAGELDGDRLLAAAFDSSGRLRGSRILHSGEEAELSAYAGHAIRTFRLDEASRPVSEPETVTDCLEVPSCSVGLTFASNGDGTCTLTGIGTCRDKKLVIPETSPAGDTVTFIAAEAFRGNAALTEVTVPDCVEKLGLHAFADCPNLAPLDVPLYKIAVGDLPAETVEEAVMAVARAFWHKNPYMQYDAEVLTVEAKAKGAPRRTTYQTPENTAWDSRHYSQCSEYCFDVWYEAMGLEYMGDRNGYGNHVYEQQFTASIVTGYDITSRGASLHLTDRAEALRILREESRPGDIVLAYGDSGHVMLIAGDLDGDGQNDSLHCWPVNGGNFDAATGAQKDEPSGSIKKQTVQDLMLSKGSSPNWCIADDSHGARWYLFRPSLMPECQVLYLTPATVSRMEYPDMVLSKSADRSIFADVTEGEEITVTETVSNLSQQDYAGLTVTEYVPADTLLVSADSACTAEGDTLRWTLDLPAGTSATLTYTVKNLLPIGETLVFPAGSAADIPTRTFSLKVGGARLSETQNAALEKLSRGILPASLQGIGFKDLDFFNYFYKEVLNADIALPKTVSAYLTGNLKTVFSNGQTMLSALPAGPQTGMTLPKHPGGRYLTTGTDKYSTVNRLMDVQEGYYTPGDLFILMRGTSTSTVRTVNDLTLLVYLGNGKVLQHTASGTSVVSFSTTAAAMLKENFFTVLRPTLGYDDLSGEVQIPDGSTVTVTTFAEFRAAASDVGVEEIRIGGTITFSAAVDAGAKSIVILPGGSVNLKSYTLGAAVLTVEGGLTATTGSVSLQSVSETQTKQFLAQYEDLPVRFSCAYEDPDINNDYNCGTKTAVFRQSDGTKGKKNIDQMLSEIPAGWTIRMDCGLVSSGVLNIPQKNLTFDVNGASFGMKNYTGEPFRVINSNPSKGGLYFRGAVGGDSRTLETSIDASGAKVFLGWTNGANVCNLTVTGSLTYGSLVLNNGSTVTGNVSRS